MDAVLLMLVDDHRKKIPWIGSVLCIAQSSNTYIIDDCAFSKVFCIGLVISKRY